MKQLLILLALPCLFACNQGNRKDSVETAEETNKARTEAPPGNTTVAAMSEDDTEFMVEAASGGLMEVQMGQMAMQKAMDPTVKDFGQMMANDHSRVNDELKALAQRKNMTLPSTPGEDHQRDIRQLTEKDAGRDFDRAYIKMMIDDHKKDVEKFEKIALDADDPDLKAFAAKHVPHLKMHLQKAEDIQNKLRK